LGPADQSGHREFGPDAPRVNHQLPAIVDAPHQRGTLRSRRARQALLERSQDSDMGWRRRVGGRPRHFSSTLLVEPLRNRCSRRIDALKSWEIGSDPIVTACRQHLNSTEYVRRSRRNVVICDGYKTVVCPLRNEA